MAIDEFKQLVHVSEKGLLSVVQIVELRHRLLRMMEGLKKDQNNKDFWWTFGGHNVRYRSEIYDKEFNELLRTTALTHLQAKLDMCHEFLAICEKRLIEVPARPTVDKGEA